MKDGAVLQHWPTRAGDRAFEFDDSEDFPAVARIRRAVQVMHFADYDHDGRQTEFYLQTEALPCGKSSGVVIGVSKINPQLHVFSSASNPDKPLCLQMREWEALRDASTGPVKVMDWQCGDHGAETQTELQLDWSSDGVNVVRREYTCPTENQPRQLIREEPR